MNYLKNIIALGKSAALADFIFPPRCPLCDRVTGEMGVLCPKCIKGPYPQRVTDPFCIRCGKQLDDDQKAYCHDCAGLDRGFKSGRAIFQYRGMEYCMYRFKNGDRAEYAVYLGKAMAELYLSQLTSWNTEAFIPIPVHSTRYRVRGYNQAALLSREITKYVRIPTDETLLIRKKKTKAQRYMDDVKRIENIAGAFAATRQCEYKSVCLVDDIYTTGSTCEAAARTLLAAGAKEVHVLCACIGRGM